MLRVGLNVLTAKKTPPFRASIRHHVFNRVRERESE